ncbi:MAG: HlyD family type I secretion periplasmic adaptor subunit [Pseudomonadota bacterium]
MFGNQIEDQYVNSIAEADAASRRRSQWPVLSIILLGLGALIAWAAWFEIEEVTTGLGRVIPSSQVQVIQTLEGGIVQAIEVKEGETVEAGATLIQIDDTGFSSSLGELQEKRRALEVEQIRLEAEAAGADALSFPEALVVAAPRAIAAEEQVFASRRQQVESEIEVLKDRLKQRQAELEEVNATITKLNATRKPVARETELTRRMFRRRVVPEIDLLRLQTQLAEIDGNLDVARASIPKLEAAIAEANNQITTARSAYILTARERLAKLQGELSVVLESIRGASDRVTRTALKSPVRGVVNKINVSTIGAVVQPGRDIMEIVPLEDSLLIEANIRPQDVAFIRTGEQASVKLTAYDYLIYGALQGTVERIGADTVEDKEGAEFFKVIVRTAENALKRGDKSYKIIPGMVASVDIQTGRKTVLTYLLKPVLRARSEALRER